MKNTIHEKAIRLVEGGIVEVEGLIVKLGHKPLIVAPCSCCEMDCLCHQGGEICNLCIECDEITGKDCYLILAV